MQLTCTWYELSKISVDVPLLKRASCPSDIRPRTVSCGPGHLHQHNNTNSLLHTWPKIPIKFPSTSYIATLQSEEAEITRTRSFLSHISSVLIMSEWAWNWHFMAENSTEHEKWKSIFFTGKVKISALYTGDYQNIKVCRSILTSSYVHVEVLHVFISGAHALTTLSIKKWRELN